MTLYRILLGRHSVATVYVEASDEEEAQSLVLENLPDEDEFEGEHMEFLEVVDVAEQQDAELGSVVRNTGVSVAEYLANRMREAEEE